MPKFSNADFCHTHAHSEHSKFDGLAKIEKSVMKAREMGFPAHAITDHGTVGGWVKFIAACNKKKDKKGKEIPFPTIKPIIGCELYVSKDHKWHGVKAEREKNPRFSGPNKQPEGKSGNRHLVAIAKNWQGYQSLCSLSETSWVDGEYYNPRIDFELLAKNSKGLIVSSACLSSVINANLLHDRYQEAKRAATLIKDIMGEDFFLEVMYHGIGEEAAIIPDVLKLGKELNVPVIATNDVHYVEKAHAKTHEVLMCFSTKRCVHDPKHLSFPHDEFYLKSADEMGRIFGHRPELLYNTVALAERIDAADIERNMGGMRLPTYKVPPEFKSPQEYLEHLAWQGMRKLGWQSSEPHVSALRMELHDVQCAKDNNNYDFASYFLIVWDYVNFARESGIYTGCGRGSGYASVLLRTLGITYGPDPIKYGLIWERFLGFDNRRFYLPSDFGFEIDNVIDIAAAAAAAEEKAEEEAAENADLDEDRELEDDLGGVDRY